MEGWISSMKGDSLVLLGDAYGLSRCAAPNELKWCLTLFIHVPSHTHTHTHTHTRTRLRALGACGEYCGGCGLLGVDAAGTTVGRVSAA